jgi:hypothetical protein
MGFVIAHLGESACLLDASGNLLREDFPLNCGLVYALDAYARPIIEWDLGSGKYYAINSSGGLIRISYAPPHDLRVDRPHAPTLAYPIPFSETVPVFWLIHEDEWEKLPENTVLYSQAQKDAILAGMSPEDALAQLPGPDLGTEETEPPEETVPPEETAPDDPPSEENPSEENPPEITGPEAPDPEVIHGQSASGEPAQTDGVTGATADTAVDPAEPSPEDTAADETTMGLTGPDTPAPDETTPDDTEAGDTETGDAESDETTAAQTEEPKEPEPAWRMTYEVRYGYKDRAGEVIVPPTYIYAFPFGANGLAAAIFWYETARTEGLCFLNTAGVVVIDVADKVLSRFTANGGSAYDGYAPALNGDISDLGSYWFDHGYVMVRRRTVLYRKPERVYSDANVLIDEKGKLFQLPDGYELCGYSEGVLLLKRSGTYGFMDVYGRWIAQPIYTEAIPFCQGLAVVRKGALWGIINAEGDFLLEPVYNAISPISSGVFSLCRDGKWELLRIMERKAAE